MKSKETGIEELKNWGVYLLYAIKKTCREKAQQPLFDNFIIDFENLILESFNKNNIVALKAIIKEVELWALGLDPMDGKIVSEMMFKKFAKHIGEEAIFKKIDLIIKRGIIRNLREYRTANEAIDIYSYDTSKKKIVHLISDLMSKFETKFKTDKS